VLFVADLGLIVIYRFLKRSQKINAPKASDATVVMQS